MVKNMVSKRKGSPEIELPLLVLHPTDSSTQGILICNFIISINFLNEYILIKIFWIKYEIQLVTEKG